KWGILFSRALRPSFVRPSVHRPRLRFFHIQLHNVRWKWWRKNPCRNIVKTLARSRTTFPQSSPVQST
ncbi:hypothetical protein ScPMuIL_018732, partial [Solemya velum]